MRPRLRSTIAVRAAISLGMMLVALAASAPADAAPLPTGQSIDLLFQADGRIDGAVAGDHLGWRGTTGVGDVNGDGLDDVVAGAPLAYNNGRHGSGSVFVVFGKRTFGRTDLATLGAGGFRIDGALPGVLTGLSVGKAGDVNGDGLADVILGAPRATHRGNGTWDGDAYVIFGKRTTETIDLANLGNSGFRIDPELANDNLGTAVGSAGDVNGDGLGDVIVTAYKALRKGRKAGPGYLVGGMAYVVFGKRTAGNVDLRYLTTYKAGYRIYGAAAGDEVSWTADTPGDMNGDGRDDVILGARYASNNGRYKAGSAYVLWGKASTDPIDLLNIGDAGFRIDGAANSDHAGRGAAGAGDVNGDRIPDVIIGARSANNNDRVDSGSAYVVFGKRTNTRVDLRTLGDGGFRIDGAAAGDLTGYSAAGVGDLNRDGRSDVVVGAFHANNNDRKESGSAYVVYGKSSNTPVDLAKLGDWGFRLDGGAADGAGTTVGGAGDVNGDGRPDVLVGSLTADNNGRPESGSVYVLTTFDRKEQIVTAPGRTGGPYVRVFSADGSPTTVNFWAYDPSFTGGVRVATGNIDNKGADEIVTGAGPGGWPYVRVFKADGTPTTIAFNAYDQGFRGGIFVASGDVDSKYPGDEIITAPDYSGGAYVRVFTGDGKPIHAFWAYDGGFAGGVRVAVADLDRDGEKEIVTGAGPGGWPYVRAFNADGSHVIEGFNAYDQRFGGGVFVASRSDAGAANDQIITGAGAGGGPHVRVFSATGVYTGVDFFPYPGFSGGIAVASVQSDSDSQDEILTGAGPGGGALAWVWEPNGTYTQTLFYAYDPNFRGGIWVAGGNLQNAR